MQFYAALHITGHVLYGTGPAITKHERHSSALEAHDSGRVIAREYEALRQLSEAARYRPAEHPMDSMTSFADRMVEAIFHHCSPD